MKKSVKYWLICVLVLAVLGLGLIITGLCMGGKIRDAFTMTHWGHLGIHPTWSVSVHSTNHYCENHGKHREWLEHHTVKEYEKKYGFNAANVNDQAVKALEIDMSGMEAVYVKTGSEYGIFASQADANLKNYVENGVWKIETQRREPLGELVIVLPENQSYDEIELELNAGFLWSDGLSAKTISAEMNAGFMELENIDCSELTAEMTAGQMIVQGNVAENADLDVMAGELQLTVPQPESYSYDVEAGMGAVQIGDRSFKGVQSSKGTSGGKPEFRVECLAGEANVIFAENK